MPRIYGAMGLTGGGLALDGIPDYFVDDEDSFDASSLIGSFYTGQSWLDGEKLGSEIATGTLSSGSLYKITATQTDHFGSGLVVGNYFTSDGTETCDANNKVKEVTASIADYADTGHMVRVYDSSGNKAYGFIGRVGTGETKDSAKTVTGITKADPGAVSALGHGYYVNQLVYFSGLTEMTELNGTYKIVTAVGGSNQFFIDDTSSYGTAETTGGSCVEEVTEPNETACIVYNSSELTTQGWVIDDDFDANDISTIVILDTDDITAPESIRPNSMAFVQMPLDKMYIYQYRKTSAVDESTPSVVSPNTNVFSTGRWLKQQAKGTSSSYGLGHWIYTTDDGVDGGAVSASGIVPLNEEVCDDLTVLASYPVPYDESNPYSVLLPAGTYYTWFYVTFYKTDNAHATLYDLTNTTQLVYGNTASAPSTAVATNTSVGFDTFVLASPCSVNLNYYVDNTTGAKLGYTEKSVAAVKCVYAELMVWSLTTR